MVDSIEKVLTGNRFLPQKRCLKLLDFRLENWVEGNKLTGVISIFLYRISSELKVGKGILHTDKEY